MLTDGAEARLETSSSGRNENFKDCNESTMGQNTKREHKTTNDYYSLLAMCYYHFTSN